MKLSETDFQKKYTMLKESSSLEQVGHIIDNLGNKGYSTNITLISIKRMLKCDLNILLFYLFENEKICSKHFGYIMSSLICTHKFKEYFNSNNQNVLQVLLNSNLENKISLASEMLELLCIKKYKLDLDRKDAFHKNIVDYLIENDIFQKNYYYLTEITKNFNSLNLYYNKFFDNKKKDGCNTPHSKGQSTIFKDKTDDFYILNDKKYLNAPAIGREDEFEQLILSLAQNKKCPLLVGDSGVGKTSIVDMLVFMIKQNKVPKFLHNQIIIEINPNDMISGTRYRGDFEEKIKKILEKCVDNNLILFIDEIHLIYGAGLCNTNESNDMASVIKYYIDRFNLRVIGTTTIDEYNKYFANDSLKRRFDRIDIKEPSIDVLYKIIEGTFNNYSEQYYISSYELLEEYPNLINDLINITKANHRTFNDKVCNPDLVISLIDKAFAYAKINDEDKLEIKHIAKSITCSMRIYESAKERFLKNISSNSNVEESIQNHQYIKIAKK